MIVCEAPPPTNAGEIFVPTKLHDLKVGDLPLSARLEGALQRKGVRHLGELHHISMRDLRGTKNCGRKTILELVRLIERAAAGEFDTASDAPSNPAEMVRILDALVSDLPDRSEEILILRLGGMSEEIPTLEQVGVEFRLTRERVRQIVEHSIEDIRKRGGPRLRSLIGYVEKACIEKVYPLTPSLLKQWLDDSRAVGRFNQPFYVRLLAELSPTIPAWPTGQDVSASRIGRNEEIESALEVTLYHGFQAVPLPQALAQVRTTRGLGKVKAPEFLATLQHSRRFKVEFPKSDSPVVRFAQRSALDASKTVLQSSDTPLTFAAPAPNSCQNQKTLSAVKTCWSVLKRMVRPGKNFRLTSLRRSCAMTPVFKKLAATDSA